MPLTKNTVIVYGIVTLILALILSAVLFGVAKTGLVDLPIFSRWYHGPQATHPIAPITMTPDSFLQMVQQRFQTESAKGQPPYTVTVDEKEVSGALQSSVQSALRDGNWSRTDIQVALRETDMEVVGHFSRGFLHPQFLVRFVPRISNGGLVFDPVFAQLGDFPLPANWMTPVLGFLFSRDFGTWTVAFGAMRLQRVQLFDGSMQLTIAPTTP
jgi:hypothetical protein